MSAAAVRIADPVCDRGSAPCPDTAALDLAAGDKVFPHGRSGLGNKKAF